MKPLKLSLLVMVFLLSFASCTTEEMATEIIEDYTIDLNLAKETNWEMAVKIIMVHVFHGNHVFCVFYGIR